MTTTLPAPAPTAPVPTQPADESSLAEYLGAFWKRRWEVLIIILAALGICLAYCAISTPLYQGSADLLIAQPLPTTLLQASNSPNPQTTIDIPTTIEVVESAAVKDIVRRTIADPPSVTATQVGLTDVLKVQTSDKNAALSADAANAYANAYLTYERGQTASELNSAAASLQSRLTSVEDAAATIHSELASTSLSTSNAGVETELVGLESVLQADTETIQSEIGLYQYYATSQSGDSGSVLTAATTPSKPASPKTTEYSIFAVIVGIILGLAWALAREFLFSR